MKLQRPHATLLIRLILGAALVLMVLRSAMHKGALQDLVSKRVIVQYHTFHHDSDRLLARPSVAAHACHVLMYGGHVPPFHAGRGMAWRDHKPLIFTSGVPLQATTVRRGV